MDKRYRERLPVRLLYIVLAILAIGLVNLASVYLAAGGGPNYATRQAIWFLIAAFAALPLIFTEYRNIERLAWPSFWISVILLIVVLVAGKIGGGSQRWIQLGPVNLQPSELAKIAVVLVLAKHFSRNPSPGGYGFRDMIWPSLLVGVPFVLILVEPDLGTAGLNVLIGAAVIFAAGLRYSTIIISLVASIPVAISGWFFVLKPYQKSRVAMMFDPESDPLGAGYHIIQSKIAIGGGALTGMEFSKGPQNMNQFLPEQHTDFIFSVLGEEWGFVGCTILIALYGLLLYEILGIAGRAKEPFGALVAVGVAAMIFWQAFINMAMVMGLFPVVGMTLPFMSYGGSSLMVFGISIGLVINIDMNRYIF